MSYPEQRMREKKMARLNKKGLDGAIQSLQIYFDARCASQEVRDAFKIISDAAMKSMQTAQPTVLVEEVVEVDHDGYGTCITLMELGDAKRGEKVRVRVTKEQ